MDSTVRDAVTGPVASVSYYPQRGLACAVALVVLATGWLVSLHLLGALNLFGQVTITATTVIVTSVIGLIVSGFLLSRIRLDQGSESGDAPSSGMPTAVKMIVGLAAVPYVALLLTSLWSYPSGDGALEYHINVALKWLQAGTMRIDPALGWQHALPGNAELPALLALAAGQEKAVAIGDMFAAILLAVSVYLVAWRITRRTVPSVLSAVIATSIPIVIFQAFEVMVDLFGTAFLVAALALILWREKSPLILIFLSGCAVGVAVGVKPVFWIYASVYGIGALAILWRTGGQRLRYLALLAAGIVLASSFWFVRAASATGNPLYPIRIPIGHTQISNGYAPNSIMHVKSFSYGPKAMLQVVTQYWTEQLPNNGRLPFGSDAGTGPLFPTLAVPGVIFLLVQTARKRTLSLEAALLLATMVLFIVWALQLRVNRFGLPVLALSSALAAPMLAELFDRFRRALLSLCFACLLLNGVFCLAGPAQRTVLQVRSHGWSRAMFYAYPPLIDHLPPGSRILNHANSAWTSMMAGVGLTNSVHFQGETKSGDYIVKAGPVDTEDTALRSTGAALIYDGTPANLYPKLATPWRIYRIP